MRFRSPNGTKLKRHLEFIPIGTEKWRQVKPRLDHGGKNLQPEYDFTYNRSNEDRG